MIDDEHEGRSIDLPVCDSWQRQGRSIVDQPVMNAARWTPDGSCEWNGSHARMPMVRRVTSAAGFWPALCARAAPATCQAILAMSEPDEDVDVLETVAGRAQLGAAEYDSQS